LFITSGRLSATVTIGPSCSYNTWGEQSELRARPRFQPCGGSVPVAIV
jgi:hypothetical protein